MERIPSQNDIQNEYFNVQAAWGMTKHMGGSRATDMLAEICNIGPESRVLVVGCGVGATSCHLARKYGCTVTGIDLSADMVKRATQRAERKALNKLTSFQVADAQDLPFANATFDAVLCESVNAFIPDKEKALREYVRVSRPGGYTGFNEVTWLKPPPENLKRYLTRIMGAEFLAAEGWKRLFETSDLEEIRAEVFKTGALRQWTEEIKQFDTLDFFRAWSVFFSMLFTSKATREFTRQAFSFPASIFRLFDYFGYGIYSGRKGS